jgi:hypothetical protein
VDTYHVVLYLHLLALFVGIGAGSIFALCLFQLRGAETLADAVPWGRVAGKTGRAFPVSIVGLYATGAYMTSDVWGWSTGWIVVSAVGLAVMTAQGVLIGERMGKKLERALHANGPGPLGDPVRRVLQQPALYWPEFGNLGIVGGIVWNMTQKPGTWAAVAAVVVGEAVGIVVGVRLAKARAQAASVAAEPAG